MAITRNGRVTKYWTSCIPKLTLSKVPKLRQKKKKKKSGAPWNVLVSLTVHPSPTGVSLGMEAPA
jgi:hypothetical protein